MAVRILSSDLVNPELAAMIVPPGGSHLPPDEPVDYSHTGVTGFAGDLKIRGMKCRI